MNDRKPEILAPAGSPEGLRAAIAAGADAVYIGGAKFGARAYAESTKKENLLAEIEYAHLKNRRVYLTVNTLLKEEEVSEELYEYVRAYYEGGVDAVIVQDVGVLHFLASHFEELPIHLSTQMTMVSGKGVGLFKDYPVTRMVPARELSLSELISLRKSTELEIEAFVHGALCYCYSGQCLFSGMVGGRSGNRGRCAQPCRMPYTLHDQGKKLTTGYLLSPKDMCTLDKIPRLVSAGIDSFKIEGRMKRPEYTAGVTAAYRLLTDLFFEYGEREFYHYLEGHPKLMEEELAKVSDLYNRGGFTDGYYFHYHGPDMMSMERPNHSGLLVGEVSAIKGSRAGIRFQKEIGQQDVLEIRSKGETYEFTVGKAGRIEENYYETNVTKGFPLQKGLKVYRTKNESLLKKIRESYLTNMVQTPVKGIFRAQAGTPATLTVTAWAGRKSGLIPGERATLREVTVTVEGERVAPAASRPVSSEKIEEQLRKTGESEFYFEQLVLQTEDGIFLPVGKIKELRREAFARLREEILSGYRRLPRSTGAQEESREQLKPQELRAQQLKPQELRAQQLKPQVLRPHEIKSQEPYGEAVQRKLPWVCLVSEEAQWKAAMEFHAVDGIYLDLQGESIAGQLEFAKRTQEGGKKAFLVMPHVFREKEWKRYEEAENLLSQGGVSGILVKSLEELAFLKEQSWAEKLQVLLNYNLYVYHQRAKTFFYQHGYTHFTAPVELNAKELEKLGVEDCDLIVYGRLPLMISTQCVRDNVMTCLHGRETKGLTLTDRLGAKFPVRQICSSCYNLIYNSACLSLDGCRDEIRRLNPGALRFDFTFETEHETRKVLETFYRGGRLSSTGEETYTRGHFKRGIL